jgi:GT2 family glycosyltransferase/glycosyltransferase involved in cell wall biosynthesis
MTPQPQDARPVQLHVIHDLGGGSAKWVEDFACADSQRTNLILRPYSHDRAMAGGVALFAAGRDEPLKAWPFARPIVATVISHPEYRQALEEILRTRRVDVLVVSSLIGHSLEVLDTGLPTLVVNHDYYPYCPAINIHFNGICRACDDRRIVECHAGNPRFNPFVEFLPADRIAVRHRYMELVRRPNVTMVVPSESVRENLLTLNAAFGDVRFVTIPHGYPAPLQRRAAREPGANERLRVLAFGQLSEAKGLELYEAALPELTRFAEVFFVGAKEVGELLRFKPHIHLVSNFDFADLPGHVAQINPHVGVLASIVPETFSYALSELWMLGVPVAATRVGAFAERIRHGENGYLFDPDPRSLARTLESIDLDRGTLARIRATVAGWQPMSAGAMVEAYHRAAPVAAGRAILPPVNHTDKPDVPAPATSEEALATQALTVSSMWKQVKNIHMQMALINEARLRTEDAMRAAARHYEHERRRLEEAVLGFTRELHERDAGLVQRDQTIAALTEQLQQHQALVALRNAQIEEVHESTSWKVSSPVRWLGHGVRKARIGAGVVASALKDPASMPRKFARVREAWGRGGWLEAKKAMVGLVQEDPSRKDIWNDYRRTYEAKVRPRIVEAIAGMNVRPLITVLVPTYNTREDDLVGMIQSVRRQLYADWELCIADDASTEPHVRAVLERYAKEDGRIHVSFAAENGGVSKATNRALAKATGDFVVFLDHDDELEEQALFRIAQAAIEEYPDMLYSDEVLVTPDGATVRRYAYRPAFSLEHLREHPYIVHLLAFKTSFLRALGGLDESLRISQDYDLILRAAEKAQTITHIPELLYRWRIHAGSAGVDRKQAVMDASRAILQRHLDRLGEKGRIEEGERFNLFEARYPLQAGLKVAIIIPTKNHGDLLEQCIKSIRDTVKDVAYDIVVVDHESDDPATRAYLLSLADSARVLRYAGVFNFSAINNFAVSQLGEGYTHYLFCNNDIEAISPSWLERMLELGQQPTVGIVGAMLFYPDRKHIQHAGVCVGMYGAAEHYGKWLQFPDDPVEPELMRVNREVSAVTAALMLVRADAFRSVEGFDEAIAVGFGDVDLCLRIGERGYRVVMSPHARLVHHESYTRGTSRIDPHPKDSALFRLKWKQVLRAGDPFYNPGYSNEHTHWPVKQPLHVAFDLRRRVVKRDPATGQTRVGFSAQQDP